MDSSTLNQLRLRNQQIAGSRFTEPAALVSWMGGLQAQDYGQALWALGSRVPGLSAAGAEQALASGAVVRTWPMRGTLHLVAAADVRWMLRLLAPRQITANAGRYRQLELDEATLQRSQEVLAQALAGGRQLNRTELRQAFHQAGIQVEGQRLAHILHRAALQQLICLGTRRGKEPTFTLLDEWVPGGRELSGEEALAELAHRYFNSHGPATLADFTWWSGLGAAEARKALDLVKPKLQALNLGGQSYWLDREANSEAAGQGQAYLLAGFEEYLLGYKDRSACLDTRHSVQVAQRNGIFPPIMILRGRVVGTWKRSFKKKTVTVETQPLEALKVADQEAFAAEARRYAAFMELNLQA